MAKNEATTEYDRIFVGYDKKKAIWEIIFWVDEKPGTGEYVFIDSGGITQAVIKKPFVFKEYTKYIEFLEQRGGIAEDSEDFKNQTETEIGYENLREMVIGLAKNELTEGFEYDIIAVYNIMQREGLGIVFMVSFWEDETFGKGEHIFINYEGVTQSIMYTNGEFVFGECVT